MTYCIQNNWSETTEQLCPYCYFMLCWRHSNYDLCSQNIIDLYGNTLLCWYSHTVRESYALLLWFSSVFCLTLFSSSVSLVNPIHLWLVNNLVCSLVCFVYKLSVWVLSLFCINVHVSCVTVRCPVSLYVPLMLLD